MTSSNQHPPQTPIEEIEAELEHEDSPPTAENVTSSAFSMSEILPPIQKWYQDLPTVGKVVVFFGGIYLGFSLLKTVLSIVSALITLTLIGGGVYLIYKFFIQSSSSHSD